jgi:hypothetical protein
MLCVSSYQNLMTSTSKCAVIKKINVTDEYRNLFWSKALTAFLFTVKTLKPNYVWDVVSSGNTVTVNRHADSTNNYLAAVINELTLMPTNLQLLLP